jgi:hypothetical protein
MTLPSSSRHDPPFVIPAWTFLLLSRHAPHCHPGMFVAGIQWLYSRQMHFFANKKLQKIEVFYQKTLKIGLSQPILV